MALTSRLRGLWDQVLVRRRKKEHQTAMKQGVSGYHLTRDQEARIQGVFSPYTQADFSSHNFYYEKTGAFYPNYIPEDIHYGYIDPYFNDWREAMYADNKCFYGRMFTGIRQPHTLASRINGMWFVGDYQPISRQALEEVLRAEPELVVKKAMGSEGGRGVFFVKGGDLASVEGRIRDDILIQRPLTQHARLSAINPTSVNTIRLISLLSEEGVKIYSAILRIGVGGARVDNASSGGITCGIDWTGKLKQYAYKSNGERFERHPDTDLVFKDHPIPSFDACMAAVPRLHVQIPRFRLISWDFAVEADGTPVLVEANLHYGQIDFHQLNNGPLFGEDTEKILREVFQK